MRRRWLIAFFVIICFVPAQAQSDEALVEVDHVVAAGESLTSIAATYGLSVADIASVNNLNPEAFLQIGQRLRIVFVSSSASAAAGSAASEGESSLQLLSRDPPANALPNAPIAPAAAPMLDLSDRDPAICFHMFRDENGNAIADPGEGPVAGGSLRLADSADADMIAYPAAESGDLTCIAGLGRQVYAVRAEGPDGFGFTAPAALRVDLRDGARLRLAFGLKQGLEADLSANPPVPPAIATEPAVIPRSPLRELSGLFVLALAAIVFVGGLFTALLMRLR